MKKSLLFDSENKIRRKAEKNKARELRRSVWWKNQMAKAICYYCKKRFATEYLSMDHKVPISRGGKTNRNNVVVSCKNCNHQKKHFLPAEIALDNLNKK